MPLQLMESNKREESAFAGSFCDIAASFARKFARCEKYLIVE